MYTVGIIKKWDLRQLSDVQRPIYNVEVNNSLRKNFNPAVMILRGNQGAYICDTFQYNSLAY
jgi:hypothetical protein